MDVFISWSGERSRTVAEALRNWLPKIINAIQPWLSSEDIDKGARWSTDVATRLENAKAGIIRLTPSNIHSDWILFEAGALSKTLQNTFVCPLLIGLEPSDVKPPLAQFQATRATKVDVLKLLNTLNAALGEGALPDAHIDESFEVWWPRLEIKLKDLPAEASKTKPHRADRELLEEILSLVRNQNRPPDAPPLASESINLRDLLFQYGDNVPHISLVDRLVSLVLSQADDKLDQIQSFKGRDSIAYQISTSSGKSYLIRMRIPFSGIDVTNELRKQISDSKRGPGDDTLLATDK